MSGPENGYGSLLTILKTPYILNNGDTSHYAFGSQLTPYKQVRSIGHGGDDYRYTSFMVRFPDQQLELVYLSNQSRFEDTQQKVFGLANLLLNMPASVATPANPPTAVPFDTVAFKAHAGRYMGTGPKNRYSFRELFMRDGRPYLSFQPQPNKHVFELIPVGDQHYLFKVDEPDVYVETWFVKSTEGNKQPFYERFKQDTLRYTRTAIQSPSRATLRRYADTYKSQELASQLKVKVDRHGLSLRRGLIKINALLVDEDTFYAPENRALFYFKRDEAGFVHEFSISATDFRHVRFSR